MFESGLKTHRADTGHRNMANSKWYTNWKYLFWYMWFTWHYRTI